MKLASLRLQLLFTLLIAVSISLATMAIYTSWAATNEFERSVEAVLRYRDPRIEGKIVAIQKFITQQIGYTFDWQGLQQLLQVMQKSSQLRFVMANLNGYVYADSSYLSNGKTINTELSKPFAAYLIEGEPVLAYFEPLDIPASLAIQEGFTRSINNSLLVAILVSGLLTLLMVTVLSRSILAPIGALTAASRRMGGGDLSHRVQTHSRGELGELAKAFNAMADGLQRLEQLRRNMVNDVAHELRTPLSTVRGYLEALQDGVVEPTPELIASLHEEVMQLNHLVEELQELALVEAGQIHLARQPLALEDVVTKAINIASPKAVARQVQLRNELPPSLPLIYADPKRLDQVLRNLLDNAIAYTPEGGSVIISATPNDNKLEIHVQDTGIGIDPDHLPYIFERFYRADMSRTRATGGSGLGLAIVKQFVEIQGGQVSAQSIPGQGTTITFTLPSIPPSNTHAPHP